MSIWTLHQSRATLNQRGLQAQLDLTRPGDGLRGLLVQGQSIDDASILGVAIEAVSDEPVDAYVRAADLVATYGETSDRPSRVQIYWRAGVEPTSDAPLIDLQISVQTNELGVPTPIETVSRVTAHEVWQLTNAADATFAPLTLTEAAIPIRAVDGAGCLLFRAAGSAWSYVEMVHPADFQVDQLLPVPGRAAELCLRHRLFPDSLEKGVILRGQIRAAWVRRDDDRSQAAALYRALLDMPPPLTT